LWLKAHWRRFSSAILPKYMRRVPSVDALIPALYLKGISTGDFSEALTAILGEGVAMGVNNPGARRGVGEYLPALVSAADEPAVP
jgi:transposase-like protein